MNDTRPVLVISDLHLGRPGMVGEARELQPLVESSSTLIVNGDAAELHLPDCADRAAAELAELRSRCVSSGTRLVLLAGNHDPELVPWRLLELAEGRILVTHGDGVDDALAPWSEAATLIRERFREVRASQAAPHRSSIDGLFEACRLAALAEFKSEDGIRPPTSPMSLLTAPRRLAEIIRFWLVHSRRIDRFTDQYRPKAMVSLVGHSHRAAITRRGDRTIINTGCFGTPGPALGVRFLGDTLSVHRLRRRRGEWRLGTEALHTLSDMNLENDQTTLEAHEWAGFAA